MTKALVYPIDWNCNDKSNLTSSTWQDESNELEISMTKGIEMEVDPHGVKRF